MSSLVKTHKIRRQILHTMTGNGHIKEATDFDWVALVEKTGVHIVAMFYSTMCPHCKEMEPYFEGYAREYEEKATKGPGNIYRDVVDYVPSHGIRVTMPFEGTL